MNAKINYPIKSNLVRMEENQDTDMEDNVTIFCVMGDNHKTGVMDFVRAWNSHTIPGVGEEFPML